MLLMLIVIMVDDSRLSAISHISQGRIGHLDFQKDNHRCGWEKLSLAQDWLNDSIKNTTELKGSKPKLQTRLPKRFLDLGEAPWKSPDKDYIRLRCPRFRSHGQYVSLSHRWGSLNQFVTTKDNLSSRREKIMFNTLPKTFRDSVVVVRALKIRYLWIDAICIIQDDPDDWRQQSTVMGGIYSNALFTIAAHAAEDTDHGFLEQSLSEPLTLRFGVNHHQRYALRAPSDFHVDVEKSHLSRRGWILQERYLSARILHFTNDQIYWEDTRGIRTEDTAEELLPRNEAPQTKTINTFAEKRSPYVSIKSADPKRLAVIPSTSGNMKKTLPDWEYMIQRYSQCGLTHQSDKLVAISGLAEAILDGVLALHPNFETSYAVGIWFHRAHSDLLWYGEQQALQASPPTSRAPSWSWASWNSRIYILAKNSLRFGRGNISLLKILRVIPDPGFTAKNSKFWLDGSGVIVMRTVLHTIHVVEHPNKATVPSIGKAAVLYIRENTDGTHEHPFNNNWFGIAGETGPRSGSTRSVETIGYVTFDHRGQRPIDKYLYFAGISETQRDLNHEPYVAFLILINDQAGSEFRRIGMGVIDKLFWDDKADVIIRIR